MFPVEMDDSNRIENENETKTSGLSFAFSKRNKTKTLGQSAINDKDQHDREEADYITSVEEKEVKSVKPQAKKSDLVIELIRTNNWRTAVVSDKRPIQTSKHLPAESDDSVEQQAIREILAASIKTEDCEENEISVIPLLMKNKVPPGFEIDEKLDVSLRPDEPVLADYDLVPIDEYGLALLRGMGWKDGEGIGKDRKIVKPIEAVARPKGLGLGADRSQLGSGQGDKKGQSDEGSLTLKRGTNCTIESGKYKGLYGLIEALDEDNARVVVKLTIGQQLVTVTQSAVRLVSKKEYEKYSKYINKAKADKYKSTDNGNDMRGEGHIQLHKYRDKASKRHHGDRESSGHHANRRHRSPEERTKHASHSHVSRHGNYENEATNCWLHANLRVRLIDPNYRKGKYYKHKVTIEDVISRGECICRTDDGQILEDMKQSMLETVIPKKEGSFVMILSTKYSGQLAQVLEKDRQKCRLVVHLLRDSSTVLSLPFDELSEYTGDVDFEY